MTRTTWGDRLVSCANRTPLAIAVFAVTLVVLGLLTALVEGWNVASGLWWAVVTASTVGYGDIAPVTVLGRILALLTMIVGIVGIGVIVGRIAASVIKTRDAWTHEEQVDLADREERILDELATIRELLESLEVVEEVVEDDDEDDEDDPEVNNEPDATVRPLYLSDETAKTSRGRLMIERAAQRGRPLIITDKYGNHSQPISSTQITNVYQQNGGYLDPSMDWLTSMLIFDALTDGNGFGGGGDTVVNEGDTTVINEDNDTTVVEDGDDDQPEAEQEETPEQETSGGDFGGDFGGGRFGDDTGTDTGTPSSDDPPSYDPPSYDPPGGSSDWSSSDTGSGGGYDSGGGSDYSSSDSGGGGDYSGGGDF